MVRRDHSIRIIAFGLIALAVGSWGLPCVTSEAGNFEEADRSPFGVNHGHNFSIMVSGGLLWHRQDFVWNAVEPENGTFVFDEFDKVVREAQEAGVRILGILDYCADWASSAPTRWTDGRDRAPPKYMEDWSDYVYTTVEHFKGRVNHWEVWNEPNTNFFWLRTGDILEYTNLLRAAYLAAKEANPECTVLIGGMIGFNFDFLREVYSYGGGKYFDVMATHPYPGDPNPCFDQFNFSDTMEELRGIMSNYGDAEKEIWFTELSWGMGPNITRQDQANYLVRSYVLSLAEGVDKLFWFNFRGSPVEEGSALIDHDFAPRPAFLAHAHLARILDGYEYDVKVDIKGVQCHSFRKGEERVLFIWVPEGSRETPLRVKSKVETLVGLGILGEEVDLGGPGKRIHLTLTESPVIVTRLTAQDIKALRGSSIINPVIVLALFGIATVVLGVYLRGAPRKKGKKEARTRKTKGPTIKCKGAFDPDLCFRCRDYAVKGSKHYCLRMKKFLE